MPPKILQNLLGHKDISVALDTYSDVFENFQTENVAKIDEYMKALGMGAQVKQGEFNPVLLLYFKLEI